jgi:hypothetical protein
VSAIWKFPLRVDDVQVIDVPLGARPLTVRVQGDEVCLWALVELEHPPAKMTVRIAGTGHVRTDLLASEYVDTFYLDGGALVFHVFASDSWPVGEGRG